MGGVNRRYLEGGVAPLTGSDPAGRSERPVRVSASAHAEEAPQSTATPASPSSSAQATRVPSALMARAAMGAPRSARM